METNHKKHEIKSDRQRLPDGGIPLRGELTCWIRVFRDFRGSNWVFWVNRSGHLLLDCVAKTRYPCHRTLSLPAKPIVEWFEFPEPSSSLKHPVFNPEEGGVTRRKASAAAMGYVPQGMNRTRPKAVSANRAPSRRFQRGVNVLGFQLRSSSFALKKEMH